MHSMWFWGGSKRTERESEKEGKVWSETRCTPLCHCAVRFCFVVLTSMMEVLGIGRLVSLVG